MPPTPHDALFKATFSAPERAAELLRGALDPALAASIDWSSLALAPGSFVDEQLRSRHADLLFRVRLGEHTIHPYILLEHKSTPDIWTLFQLLKYMVRIWEAQLVADPARTALAPIVPVVVYHGAHGWSVATEFSALVDIPPGAELLRAYTPRFGCILADLSATASDALRSQDASAAVRLTLLALKEARGARDLPSLVRGWLGLLRELLGEPGAEAARERIFSYLYAVRGPAEFDRLDLEALDISAEDEANMALMAGDLIRKGFEQGFQQGSQQGFQQGSQQGSQRSSQALFLRLLRRKFPQVSAAHVARVEAADVAAVERWSDQLLTAATLDEVFA